MTMTKAEFKAWFLLHQTRYIPMFLWEHVYRIYRRGVKDGIKDMED